MAEIGRGFLAGICLVVLCFNATANSDAAAKAFDQKFWQTTIDHLTPLLDSNTELSGKEVRMLGLSYFMLQDLETAYPFLNEALRDAPDDIDLNKAMMELMLAKRKYRKASQYAAHLAGLGAAGTASLARARIDLEQEGGDSVGVKNRLLAMVTDSELSLALDAADLLIEAHLVDGELGSAYEVARVVVGRYPDLKESVRYAPFLPENQVAEHFGYDLGYRIEFDDNVTFPDDTRASGEEDFRHVLMADIFYERPLRAGWNLYALGNILRSFHDELDTFDQTRLAGTIAVGQTGQKSGWRFPLEVRHERLDGGTYYNSVALTPGYYLQFSKDLFSHFYARLESRDYDIFSIPQENQSGDITGAGVLVGGQLSPRLQLRSYMEFNQHDTDGSYWERDEFLAFVYGEFEISSKWQTGMAIRYRDESYENARRDFDEVQDDVTTELSVNLTHKFSKNWSWRAQVSVLNQDSNISVFDYDRNVYSFAISREH